MINAEIYSTAAYPFFCLDCGALRRTKRLAEWCPRRSDKYRRYEGGQAGRIGVRCVVLKLEGRQ
jgi:hypothetical protein